MTKPRNLTGLFFQIAKPPNSHFCSTDQLLTGKTVEILQTFSTTIQSKTPLGPLAFAYLE